MGAITGNQVIVFEWIMVGATFLLILFRYYIRNIRRQMYFTFDWIDFFIFAAWISFVIQGAFDTLLNTMGFFASDVDPWELNQSLGTILAMKYYYIENALYVNCMYCIKCAMLVFFHKLIPKSMRVTYALYWTTIVLVVLGWVLSILLGYLYCMPVQRNWALDDSYCANLDQPAVVGITFGFHLLTDFLLYSLPIAIVKTVRLPLRQKIGVGVTFSVGFLCIAFAVALLVTTYTTISSALVYVFCVMEQTWAIIVGCAPAFKSLVMEVKKSFHGSQISQSRRSALVIRSRSNIDTKPPVPETFTVEVKAGEAGWVKLHTNASTSQTTLPPV